jgi:hypothetical protein
VRWIWGHASAYCLTHAIAHRLTHAVAYRITHAVADDATDGIAVLRRYPAGIQRSPWKNIHILCNKSCRDWFLLDGNDQWLCSMG